MCSRTLRNVSAPCRQCGGSHTPFYEYKARSQEQELDGLMDLPPIHKRYLQRTYSEVVVQMLALSLEYPNRDCIESEVFCTLIAAC